MLLGRVEIADQHVQIVLVVETERPVVEVRRTD